MGMFSPVMKLARSVTLKQIRPPNLRGTGGEGLLNVQIESGIGLGPQAITKRIDLFQYQSPETFRSMLP
jgi:hypothetical protein